MKQKQFSLARWLFFATLSVAMHSASCEETGWSISGIYEIPETVTNKAEHFSSPLIDFRQIKPTSRIQVADTGSNLVRITSVQQDGTAREKTVDLSQSGYVRNAGSIEYEAAIANVGARILPGKTSQKMKLTFKTDEQGNLQIVRNVVEQGFMLFVIPFSENRESTLILRRVADLPPASQAR